MASKKRDGLYRRGRFWWVRTDPLEGVARTTGCTDLEAARLWRAARERLAADPANAAAQEARLDVWVGRTIAMIARDRSAATVEVYETKLGHFRRLWGEDCRLVTIDESKLDGFVTARRGEGASDETISREVRHLLVVLKLAKRAKSYGGDLTTLRPLDLHGSYTPRTRALGRAELVVLLATCSPSLGALVRVCVALGCRRSEAIRLTPDDVRGDLARIRGTKTAGADRVVPVLSLFRAMLDEALPLLPIKVETTNVNRELYWACRRAEIGHVSFNDLRRTHVTWLLELGADRDHVRRLLGHATTKLVDTVYGQPKPEAIAALIEPKLLGAGVTGTLHSQDKEGDPSENRTRVTGVRGRSRGPVWLGRKAHSVENTADREPTGAGQGQASRDRASKNVTGRSKGAWILGIAAASVLGRRAG